jgi:trans-aconitate 3-methyltransferase
MTTSPHQPAPSSGEITFRSYTKEQGRVYAENRRGYSPDVYKTIIEYHTSNDSLLDTILDVGCGPGTSISVLAPHFAHAIGIDPSQGMISNAKSINVVSSTSKPIRFEVAAAEDLGSSLSPPIENDSVDLITASTAAHWFDMDRFWPRAAEILKPGGTVALWCVGAPRLSPSFPSHTALQTIVNWHGDVLRDYYTPGNILAQDLYVNLPLPWTLAPPVKAFSKESFVRKEYRTENSSDPEIPFMLGEDRGISLDMMELLLSTASPVTRWREAHPNTVGTEEDVVRILRRRVEKMLQESGVEKGNEQEVLKANMTGVLLLVKKKSAL